MRVILSCCVVVVLVLAGAPVHALESLVLYDSFTASTINPAKWAGFEFFGRGTEAKRWVDGAMGELSVSYRAFGDTTSNSGRTFSAFGLLLSKNTALIKSLQAQVGVLASPAPQATNCANNPATTQSRTGLRGSFFSSGSTFAGGATNDVHALLSLRDDPSNSLHVLAQVIRCTNQLCTQFSLLQELDLGTVSTGQLVQLRIEWDKPNKKFLFQSTPVATNVTTAKTISYTLPDSAAPTVALKALEVADWVENCTTTPRPTGFMNVVFDNVKVNQSANP